MKLLIKNSLLILSLLFISIANADDYVVQVGDVIRISLPGEDSIDKNFDVDRLGRIHLPEVGTVLVSGLNEKTLETKVREKLASVFQDLLNLHVYVYRRQMMINVLGYVEKPGEVVLSADSSVQTVIREAGGLKAGAQLDKLHIRRNGEVVLFDYKKYLDSGDPSILPNLRSLDTVFVPASPKIGNVEVEFDPAKIADAGDASDNKNAIKVFGEVNSPGSFSYLKSLNLIDLIMRAGGVTRYAGVEQIRVITGGSPRLFNLKSYLDSGDAALLPELVAGATIFIPRQEEAVKSGANTVYVMGEVFHPGAYESTDQAGFMDILANAGGPTRYAESRQIRILKANGDVTRFDLAAYTEGAIQETPPIIQPGDAIFVPEKTDMNEKSWLKVAPDRAVRVIGEVVRPGRIEWSAEMSLMDLLAHVGGPVSRADTSNIEVVTPLGNGKTERVVFNLDEFVRSGKNESQLPSIRAGSLIRVHDLPQDPVDNKAQWVRQASKKSIYVFGQVGAPGRYMFTNEMTFLDILSAADGPTEKADLHNIRINHRDQSFARVTRLNLALYFETGDENLLPKVQTGDTIYIPEKNRLWIDQSKESTVRVLGAVNKPGRYRFNDSMTILDILAEAGGTSANAWEKRISIVNLSCCQNHARSFNLLNFSKTGAIEDLPLLRAGDTIYVPNREDSTAVKARKAIGDLFKVISLTALFGV